jgi:hypothetical protein
MMKEDTWCVLGITPELDPDDPFEATVNRVLGDRIRGDDVFALAMWSATTNIDWRHVSGAVTDYSFRTAANMVAAIRGKGDYMDWYGQGNTKVVSPEIVEALAAEGWTPHPI